MDVLEAVLFVAPALVFAALVAAGAFLSTCHLPGACAIDLCDVGHAGLLVRPSALQAVIDAVQGRASPERLETLGAER